MEIKLCSICIRNLIRSSVGKRISYGIRMMGHSKLLKSVELFKQYFMTVDLALEVDKIIINIS